VLGVVVVVVVVVVVEVVVVGAVRVVGVVGAVGGGGVVTGSGLPGSAPGGSRTETGALGAGAGVSWSGAGASWSGAGVSGTGAGVSWSGAGASGSVAGWSWTLGDSGLAAPGVVGGDVVGEGAVVAEVAGLADDGCAAAGPSLSRSVPRRALSVLVVGGCAAGAASLDTGLRAVRLVARLARTARSEPRAFGPPPFGDGTSAQTAMAASTSAAVGRYDRGCSL
jgi:hypothetical protein